MTTNLKSVQTSAVMTTVFTRSNATPVANEAMFRAAGQRLRYPRHQESRGSNVCPDPSTLLPPPPPPSALAYPMPLADCVAMEHLEMEGRKGEDTSYEQARGGSRLTTRKRQAFEAGNELNHVQLHNKKNVGRRPSHSTSNMRNCDEEANQVILNFSSRISIERYGVHELLYYTWGKSPGQGQLSRSYERANVFAIGSAVASLASFAAWRRSPPPCISV